MAMPSACSRPRSGAGLIVIQHTTARCSISHPPVPAGWRFRQWPRYLWFWFVRLRSATGNADRRPWAGAGQAHPAKGLHTHHGTDHITVNIDISHPDPAFDISSKALISALDAEGQTKTAAVDAVDVLVQICGAVAGDVQNRPEMFLVELADTLQPERCGGDELASLAELLRNRSLCQQALHQIGRAHV